MLACLLRVVRFAAHGAHEIPGRASHDGLVASPRSNHSWHGRGSTDQELQADVARIVQARQAGLWSQQASLAPSTTNSSRGISRTPVILLSYRGWLATKTAKR